MASITRSATSLSSCSLLTVTANDVLECVSQNATLPPIPTWPNAVSLALPLCTILYQENNINDGQNISESLGNGVGVESDC